MHEYSDLAIEASALPDAHALGGTILARLTSACFEMPNWHFKEPRVLRSFEANRRFHRVCFSVFLFIHQLSNRLEYHFEMLGVF